MCANLHNERRSYCLKFCPLLNKELDKFYIVSVTGKDCKNSFCYEKDCSFSDFPKSELITQMEYALSEIEIFLDTIENKYKRIIEMRLVNKCKWDEIDNAFKITPSIRKRIWVKACNEIQSNLYVNEQLTKTLFQYLQPPKKEIHVEELSAGYNALLNKIL